MTELPAEKIRDPRVLRAIAHPVRLRLMEQLAIAGPATATQLAERVGESPANCSWHLRQLARYGYVEEAGGSGRQRPWRLVPRRRQWGGAGESTELARAGEEADAVLQEHEFAAMRAAMANWASEPDEWRDAQFVTQSFGWFTAEELAELHHEVTALLIRRMERLRDPATRPLGARPVRLFAWGVPAEPYREPDTGPEPGERGDA
jgi:DNA-binding transcriptional ArsR family regulator